MKVKRRLSFTGDETWVPLCDKRNGDGTVFICGLFHMICPNLQERRHMDIKMEAASVHTEHQSGKRPVE